MPVVINEFEVIAEQPPPEQQRTANRGEAASEQRKALRTADILRIQEWQRRRLERLWAD